VAGYELPRPGEIDCFGAEALGIAKVPREAPVLCDIGQCHGKFDQKVPVSEGSGRVVEPVLGTVQIALDKIAAR